MARDIRYISKWDDNETRSKASLVVVYGLSMKVGGVIESLVTSLLTSASSFQDNPMASMKMIPVCWY